MKILGIHDGHTATAALMEDGKILSVISEERLNRKKEWFGFPKESIKKILEIHKIKIKDIDLVVICGKSGSTTYNDFMRKTIHPYLIGFNAFKKVFPKSIVKKNWWVNPIISITSKLRKKKEIYSFFDSRGFDRKKIIFLDHHTCHAYTAFSNPWGQKDDMLILTLDAAGDGLCGTINTYKNGKFKVLDKINVYNSLGLFYSRLTQYLNMKPLSHEYKVMGLAAYTKESETDNTLKILKEKFFRIDPKNPLRMENLSGATNWEYLRKFEKFFGNVRFDNLAGGAQRLVEELLVQWVKNAVKITGIKNVFCAGGVFMNVKANMKIIYSNITEKFFVFPSCGDESNAIGACNFGYWLLCKKNNLEFLPEKLENIYFGPDFAEKEIMNAIHKFKNKINYKKTPNINKFTAELLARGEIVARCSGKMEFGARALGNRSILAHPNKIGVTREINDAIKQRDFWMPFACTILDKYEEDYIINPKKVPAYYMILSFKTKDRAHTELINGMHQYDLTIRPQILKKEHNPDYYGVISNFKKLTGIGGVLNTSFNIHGEPIVCSPEDAIDTFIRSGLKHLVIDNYYISKK